MCRRAYSENRWGAMYCKQSSYIADLRGWDALQDLNKPKPRISAWLKLGCGGLTCRSSKQNTIGEADRQMLDKPMGMYKLSKDSEVRAVKITFKVHLLLCKERIPHRKWIPY